MHKLTEFAFKYKSLTILMLVFIAIAGTFTYINMPKREDPEIIIRTANVVATYPGMSPYLTENLIAKPIERKIKEIPEVEEIRTTVTTGYVDIYIDLYDKYFNVDPIWQDLRNKMDDVLPDLPQGTGGPFVNDDYGDVTSAVITLTGEDYTYADLREAAFDIQDDLSIVTSVSRVQIYGNQEERMWIKINPARLAFYEITPQDLINQLQNQNIIQPGGAITTLPLEIPIEPSGAFDGLKDIQNFNIKVPDEEQIVLLKDIAEVTRGYVDPPVRPVYFNNQPSIAIGVEMVEKFNIEIFEDYVLDAVAEIEKDLPAGMNLDFAAFQPEPVKVAVQDAAENLYQTIVVVLLVVMAFLGLRTGIVVGSIVPLTILMSLLAMNAWGIELQRMSIAAIIVSLGLLVDNAIVIAEDMQTRMRNGESKMDSALNASKTLSLPLLTSSLTTILAFGPLMLADDVAGEYLRSLGQGIITTLLSSWFLAIYAIPFICFYFLPSPEKAKIKEFPDWVLNGYKRLLTWILNLKKLFLLLIIGVFVISVMYVRTVPRALFPESDRPQYLIDVDLPAGTSVEETERAIRELSSWLIDEEKNPEVESVVAYTGFGGPRFFLTLSPADPAANIASLVVNTINNDATTVMVERTNKYMKEYMPEIDGSAKKMWLGISEIGLVEYRISGDSKVELYNLANKIKEGIFREIPNLKDLDNDWQNLMPRINIVTDQSRARRANISSNSIATYLETYLDGTPLSDYREADKVIPILLKGEEELNNINKLKLIPLLSDDNNIVPLEQVGDVEFFIQPGKVKRYNLKRTVTIGVIHESLPSSIVNKMIHEKVLSKIELPYGYKIEEGGEVEDQKTANKALFQYMPHCFALIVLLMVWQFNSIAKMSVIILTIPLVIIGAALSLLITGSYLDFNGMLGLFSLAGIIVNNGIVLIDQIDRLLEEYDDKRQAVIDACAARLRPILMTTLTTFLGLMPLIFFGGALWFAMATIIAGGICVGTIFTLGFVPALYCVIFKIK